MKPSGVDKLQRSSPDVHRLEPRASEVLGAAFGSAVLYLSGIVLPLLLPMLMVCPFPLIVLRLRGNALMGTMAMLLAAALISALFTPGHALLYLMVLALPGYALAETMARGRGLVKASGVAFAILTAQILVALAFANPTMSSAMLEPFQRMQAPETLQQLKDGGFTPDQIDEWKRQFSTMHGAMSIVYPATWIVMGALLVLSNAALLRAYLARRDPGWLDGGEFESIRWPLALPVVFVASGLAVLVEALRPAAYNVLLVLAFFFMLQGLAVVTFYAFRLAGPPVLRIGVLLLVLVNPWAPHILGLLGLFDTWIDFRGYAEPPEAKKQG